MGEFRIICAARKNKSESDQDRTCNGVPQPFQNLERSQITFSNVFLDIIDVEKRQIHRSASIVLNEYRITTVLADIYDNIWSATGSMSNFGTAGREQEVFESILTADICKQLLELLIYFIVPVASVCDGMDLPLRWVGTFA